jgi:hypothetical protein
MILDTDIVEGLELPMAVKLVSIDEVKSMAMDANGTRVHTVDRISLTTPTRGIVKFSGYHVSSVGGVPVTWSVEEITYFLEKRDGDWVIYGTTIGFGDYFRAIPLSEIIPFN